LSFVLSLIKNDALGFSDFLLAGIFITIVYSNIQTFYKHKNFYGERNQA